MATGAKKGLNPARQVGSGVTNQSLSEYTIMNQYASDLFAGDPVKLNDNGNIVKATAGDDIIGVFLGVNYTDTSGEPVESLRWPASTNSDTTPKAKVMDASVRTFTAQTDGTTAQLNVGDLLGFDFGTGSTVTNRSAGVLKSVAVATGSLDIAGETDLGANTAISDTDAFTVRTLQAGSATTVTISDGDGTSDLESALNAVANISATTNSSGFLEITATDGYDLELLESTGTPLADLGLNVGITRAKANKVTAVGDVDLDGETDIGANIVGVADLDAFTIQSSASGAEASTITIANGDGSLELLQKLNDVPGIKADLNDSGFLRIKVTDGGNLVIAESTNTPAAALGFTAGTYAAPGAFVKLKRITDASNNVVEVALANHEHRSDG